MTENRIGQLASCLREAEIDNERAGRFVGARARADENGNVLLEVNGAAAIHLSRLLLDLAMSEAAGSHQHLDTINFFEEGSLSVTISKGCGEA